MVPQVQDHLPASHRACPGGLFCRACPASSRRVSLHSAGHDLRTGGEIASWIGRASHLPRSGCTPEPGVAYSRTPGSSVSEGARVRDPGSSVVQPLRAKEGDSSHEKPASYFAGVAKSTFTNPGRRPGPCSQASPVIMP